MGEKALALQLCGYSDYLTAGLAERVEPVRWFELDEGERAAFLANQAQKVRIVATGGHLGCPTDLLQALPGP